MRTSMDAVDSAALFGVLLAGAVVGFTITGSAALGTAVGAVAGLAWIAARHRRDAAR